MKTHNHFCNRCILPEGFLGLTFNKEGLCNYCADPDYTNPNWSRRHISEHQKTEALKDWNETIKYLQDTKEEREYDCVLGYSGGKDSTALLDMLIHDYKLRPLAITIDNGQMPDIAKDNIDKTLTTLDYTGHHFFINQAIPTFSKLYRYLFLHHSSNEEMLASSICGYCSDLIHGILVKEALKRHISVIVLGYSPDQVKRYFYEIPPEEIRLNWHPEFIQEKPFTALDRNFFLKTEDLKELGNVLPRILLAYHALPYEETSIIEQVNEKGLIKKGKADPILTNCHVIKAAMIYDFHRFGGMYYALQYAELVRQASNGKNLSKARKKWLRLYKYIAKSILSGTFAKQQITKFLSQIDLTKGELLNKTSQYLEQDPNKDTILKIKGFIS